jgi:hypothetical protein
MQLKPAIKLVIILLPPKQKPFALHDALRSVGCPSECMDANWGGLKGKLKIYKGGRWNSDENLFKTVFTTAITYCLVPELRSFMSENIPYVDSYLKFSEIYFLIVCNPAISVIQRGNVFMQPDRLLLIPVFQVIFQVIFLIYGFFFSSGIPTGCLFNGALAGVLLLNYFLKA